MLRFEKEKPEDYTEIEVLLDNAFGLGRTNLSSYQLRIGNQHIEALSMVAKEDDGSIVGSIRFWPVRVGQNEFKVLLLGPIAVHHTHQGEGIGSYLIGEGISKARELDWEAILLVGDEPYYSKFGFSVIKTVEFPPPTDPNRILCLELTEGTRELLKGRVRIPSAKGC
ncbi:MAG: N-acetyltransferase [Paracoccaceae bacterium]|nr:N-acetyltransferase [Paracoccaceae bacterium]MDE2674210.1 N-acetyltransferase [Paracoccaceae bacterium]MYJ86189.1 N-acetyltransferase [Paracoccaceae bacterium]